VFVFETQRVTDDVELTLQPDEISEVFWLSASEAVERHTEPGRDRIAAAFTARASGRTAYLDSARSLAWPAHCGRVLVPAREIAELSRGRRAGVAAEREVYWGA